MLFTLAQARPWIAARCVLAALGHPTEDSGDGPAWRLVGARILAEGALASAGFVQGFADAGKKQKKK